MIFHQAELHNVRALLPIPDGKGYRICRLPESVLPEVNQGVQNTAFYGPGCEIRFNINSGLAQVTLRRAARGTTPVDPSGIAEIWFGSFPGDWEINPRSISPAETTLTIQNPGNLPELRALAQSARMPFDPGLVRIILPYDWYTELVEIQGDIEPPRPGQAPGLKQLSYGSSITHGGNAIRPSETYAMLTAQHLGADLINLGFPGSAQMEPALGDYIARDLDWDFATLEMGINVISIWTVEQFAERVNDFVARVALPHPDRWIFCIDLFTCQYDYTGDPKISAYRKVVEDAVRRHNLPRLVYLNGRSLLRGPSGLTIGLVHPSAAGMAEIAANLAGEISRRLF